MVQGLVISISISDPRSLTTEPSMEEVYNDYVLGRNPQASIRQVPRIRDDAECSEPQHQDKTDRASSSD